MINEHFSENDLAAINEFYESDGTAAEIAAKFNIDYKAFHTLKSQYIRLIKEYVKNGLNSVKFKDNNWDRRYRKYRILYSRYRDVQFIQNMKQIEKDILDTHYIKGNSIEQIVDLFKVDEEFVKFTIGKFTSEFKDLLVEVI